MGTQKGRLLASPRKGGGQGMLAGALGALGEVVAYLSRWGWTSSELGAWLRLGQGTGFQLSLELVLSALRCPLTPQPQETLQHLPLVEMPSSPSPSGITGWRACPSKRAAATLGRHGSGGPEPAERAAPSGPGQSPQWGCQAQCEGASATSTPQVPPRHWPPHTWKDILLGRADHSRRAGGTAPKSCSWRGRGWASVCLPKQ